MNINFLTIGKFLSLEVHGDDTRINNIVVDSRKVRKGDLFIAIHGKNRDGHLFIQESIKKGAAAVICNDSWDVTNIKVPYIVSGNTIESLGLIALGYKRYIGSPFTIGITGTNGKTSVTKLTSHILCQSFAINTTIGNYNNEIGLPLSILQSQTLDTANKCIYEMGASKKNDINYLVTVCEPNMTTLLNVSEAHMESFGSMDNLISTKEEIFSHPNTSQVVLNVDDKNFCRWEKINRSKKIIKISLKNKADYFIKSIDNDYYHFSTLKGNFRIEKRVVRGILPINILFSIALAMEAGASVDDVNKGLKSYNGVEGRFFHFVSSNGSTVIDDSYNANPESMKSSLMQLNQYDKKKIFVMGDMGELGEHSLEHHIDIFKLAKKCNIKYLFYMGKYKDEASQSFGDGFYHFSDVNKLTENVRNIMDKDTVVLIKASRYMNFDLIAKGLK